MEKIKHLLLSSYNDYTKIEKFLFLFFSIFLTYSFSIFIRYYVVTYAFENPNIFMYKNNFLATTNDAYFFMKGITDIVNNTFIENSRNPIHNGFVILMAYIYKIFFGFTTIENFCYFSSMFISSLIVIPLVFLGILLNKKWFGVITAFIVPISTNYFTRNITGYFTYDMFNLMTPLWYFISFMLLYKYNNKQSFFFHIFITVFSLFLYGQSYSIFLSIYLMFLLYIIYDYYINKNYQLFQNKTFNWIVFTLLIESIILVSSNYIINIMLAHIIIFNFSWLGMTQIILLCSLFIYLTIIIYLLKNENKVKSRKKLYYIFTILTVITFQKFNGFEPIINRFSAYVFNEIPTNVQNSLNYYDVVRTITESKLIDLNTLQYRTIHYPIYFIISLIGYITFIYYYPIMIITLPLLCLGFLSIFAGVRFISYMIPVLMMGFVFFFYFLYDLLLMFLNKRNLKKEIKQLIIFLFIGLVCYNIFILIRTNVISIISMTYTSISTVLSPSKIENLEKLNKIKSDGYVYSWWDYGYINRFYSNKKTLTDGGKHNGSDNYIESIMLSYNSQKIIPQLLNDTSSIYEYKFKTNQSDNFNIFEEILHSYNIDKTQYKDYYQLILKNQLNKSNIKNLEHFKKDNYIIFYDTMIPIYTVIMKFSNIDLNNGKLIERNDMIYQFEIIYKQNNDYLITKNIVYNIKNKKVYIKNIFEQLIEIPIRNITIINKNNEIERINYQLNQQNNINNLVINLKQKSMILIDDITYQTNFVQMFLIHNYDKSLFQPLIENSEMMILKVK